MRPALLLLFALPLGAQQPLPSAIKDLSSQIAASASRQEKRTIAVVPFRELDSDPTVLGTYLAEELVTALFQTSNFKIVERQLLDRVFEELRIGQTGAIDPKTAKEIGRIAAVDAIITGSITELQTYFAINCRIIDTTTGEVFGAANTRLAKDDDVIAIGGTSIAQPRASAPTGQYRDDKSIATKEAGPLRVTLKSVRPVTLPGPYGTTPGLRLTFELTSRDARDAIHVALNANEVTRDAPPGSPATLRASIIDEARGLWSLRSHDVGNIGVIRAGVHGERGSLAYAPTDVPRLLQLRDTIGRDNNDPSDGRVIRADSCGEGGCNTTFGPNGITSPPKFFPYTGNQFISGTTTPITPGERVTVTLDFRAHQRGATTPQHLQASTEFIVGQRAGRQVTYRLHTVNFDRISTN